MNFLSSSSQASKSTYESSTFSRETPIWTAYPEVLAYDLTPQRSDADKILQITEEKLNGEDGWRIHKHIHVTLAHKQQEFEQGDEELEKWIDSTFSEAVLVEVREMRKDDKAVAFAVEILNDKLNALKIPLARLRRLHMTVALKDNVPPVYARHNLFSEPLDVTKLEIIDTPKQKMKMFVSCINKKM